MWWLAYSDGPVNTNCCHSVGRRPFHTEHSVACALCGAFMVCSSLWELLVWNYLWTCMTYLEGLQWKQVLVLRGQPSLVIVEGTLIGANNQVLFWGNVIDSRTYKLAPKMKNEGLSSPWTNSKVHLWKWQTLWKNKCWHASEKTVSLLSQDLPGDLNQREWLFLN